MGERDASDKGQSGGRLNPGDQAKPGTPGTGENVARRYLPSTRE